MVVSQKPYPQAACLQKAKGFSALVRVSSPDPQARAAVGRPFLTHSHGHSVFSGSGVLLDPRRGLIVTHGSLVSPFLKAAEEQLSVTSGTVIQVLLEGDSATANLKWRPAQFLKFVEVPETRHCFSQVTQEASSWSFGWQTTNGTTLPHSELWNLAKGFGLHNMNISGLALLQLEDVAGIPAETPLTTSCEPFRFGEPVYMVTSPYGALSARIFHNHVTAGVLSNIVYPTERKYPGLYIVDGRIFPGSEGGLVISAEGHFMGIISPPLKSKETPVELNLVIPASSVTQAFAEYLTTLTSLQTPNIGSKMSPTTTAASSLCPAITSTNVAEKAQQVVVMISISGTWASGVIVSPDGYVLTNAHVVKPYVLSPAPKPLRPVLQPGANLKVRVDHPSQRWVFGVEVVFVSYSIWDIALLKLPSAEGPYPFINFEALPKSALQEMVGHPVYTIGHGLFSSMSNLRPTVSAGLLSKLLAVDGADTLLLSSAAVHRGNSGGLLIDATSGSPLGIVSNNIRHSTPTGTQLVPRLNMIIPASALAPLARYLESKDVEEFSFFAHPSGEIEEVWQLKSREDPVPGQQKKKSSKL